MSIEHVAVAVIGAGPTGVAAATLLAQYGIDCLVLDRWAEVYPQPRAVHLDDEVCRIIDRLGVSAEFAALCRPALGLRLADKDLTVLSEFTRDTTLSANGFPQANMFDQPALEQLLRANLRDYPCARLLGGVEVTEVCDDGSGPIRIVGSMQGRKVRFTADYVLGCDGANSVVRNGIGSAMRDLRFEQRWMVIDVATAADLHQWEGVHQVCDRLRAGTFMRIGDTRYRWEFRLLPGESATDFASVQALRPLIAPWTREVIDRDLELIRVTEYTFRARIADRWRRGNVFLLGDAAHLTPPFIGQGLGAGLRDAMNLTWKLAAVITGAMPRAILGTYERERKPHARSMIRLALAVGRAMTAGGRAGDRARSLLIPRLHRIPGMRARIVDSTTPALRRSALVRKSPRSRLAGRLCPNPALGGERLDDHLGTGFAVISSRPLDPAQEARIRARGAVVHVADANSNLAAWLQRGHATAAIVRPDRTVMCAGRDVAALCSALPVFSPCVTGSTR